MGLPNQPVTLTVEEIDQLNRKLSTMRHDVNNTLSLMIAAIEVLRHKPEMTGKMVSTLIEQPPRIVQGLAKFSEEFEKTFGITRS